MPELPEVETVVRTLEHQLGNVTIKDCHVLWDNIIAYPTPQMFCAQIKGKTIQHYERYGKYLLFDLGSMMWIAHMRMEGKKVMSLMISMCMCCLIYWMADNCAIMILANSAKCIYMRNVRISISTHAFKILA